ncbi:MAG: pirin family protein [Gammaproteobacteria bacterium]|nr:pirin family protein [Gammaproteobacteria bacterium]
MSDTASVELVIEPVSKDLGEFTVRRALPDKRRQRIGPFIFFDHMGPADFPPGSGVNVRSHPHIGLATITYLFNGEILHRDSLGYVQRIQPGAVNWMTAGRGIVHSEKVTDEIRESGQFLHGIQTWVALPTNAEEIAPSFQHYPADSIPAVELNGVTARVIIGRAFGVASPVSTCSETLYVEARIDKGKEMQLPQAQELGIYVVDGRLSVAGKTVDAGQLAVFENVVSGCLLAESECHVMICGGDTLDGERYIWWNFVSSCRERMEQAKNDWRDGRFDDVPNEEDFIPLPQQ